MDLGRQYRRMVYFLMTIHHNNKWQPKPLADFGWVISDHWHDPGTLCKGEDFVRHPSGSIRLFTDYDEAVRFSKEKNDACVG